MKVRAPEFWHLRASQKMVSYNHEPRGRMPCLYSWVVSPAARLMYS